VILFLFSSSEGPTDSNGWTRALSLDMRSIKLGVGLWALPDCLGDDAPAWCPGRAGWGSARFLLDGV
jgi:predicted transcriptional regulator